MLHYYKLLILYLFFVTFIVYGHSILFGFHCLMIKPQVFKDKCRDCHQKDGRTRQSEIYVLNGCNQQYCVATTCRGLSCSPLKESEHTCLFHCLFVSCIIHVNEIWAMNKYYHDPCSLQPKKHKLLSQNDIQFNSLQYSALGSNTYNFGN